MKTFLFLIFSSLMSSFCFAAVDWADLNRSLEQKSFLKLQEKIQSVLEKKPSKEDLERLEFFQIWVLLQSGQYPLVVERAQEVLKNGTLFEEEIRGFLADAYVAMHLPKSAEAENVKILALSPHFQLKQDTQLRQVSLRLQQGDGMAALRVLRQIEKKARGTPGYPQIIYQLAELERKLGTHLQFCHWALRLYRRYPSYDLVRDWGADLATNHLGGEKTNCRNSLADFRDRAQALLWHGEDEKARTETLEVTSVLKKEKSDDAPELQAWYLLQTGSPDEALQILKPLLQDRKNNVSFLRTLASAAARSGDGGASVAAFHRIWELQPRSESGRRALYQSAILSYQFQDYDGAGRRFREFIAKYPRSGLARDAKWNLAWISYLKGDYIGTRAQLSALLSDKAKSGRERNQYWLAMAYFREGKFEDARPLFAALVSDRDTSYYGLAAKQRLAQLPVLKEASVAAVRAYGPRLFGPRGAAETLWPSESNPSDGFAVPVAEELETEETLANESVTESVAEPDGEATADLVQETGRSDVEPIGTNMKSVQVSRRFDRVRGFLEMGLYDRARWELYEIELRSRSGEETQKLIQAYERAEQWHRSSHIAQARGGASRLEDVFPQAFLQEVMTSSQGQGVPREFLWAIMRTESHYRREAVSPVGALGLMQIMPGTGRKLAALQKDNDYATQQLLMAPVAIRYGAYYLRRLLNEFSQQIPLTAAAYNAGPHRVHGWLIGFGKLDMDEFIEHIPFIETRDYVRKVVSAAMSYAHLYGAHDLKIDLVHPSKMQGRLDRSKKENWEATN